MRQPADIKKKFSSLKTDEKWTFSNNQYERYSHNYHRYPAKFISPLANEIISKESTENDLVCDIFGGCGTTLLEAKLLGRKSIGVDINPVAKLITEVKTKAIDPEKLEKSNQRLIARIDEFPVVNDYASTHERIRYWFSESAYLELSRIYAAILVEENKDIQKFFLCAFSHCLKNGSRWLMKSIKPTIDKQKLSIDISKSFKRHLKGMIKKNGVLYEKLRSEKRLSLDSSIFLKDITKSEKKWQADLIVTSPPYVTSYEYGDLHQLTLLWFGQKKYKNWSRYLSDLKEFKSQFIGSSVYSKVSNNDMGSSLADNIVDQLHQKDHALANKVSTYFARMNQAFKVMYTLLKKDKKACIIIGNTKLRQVPILNAEVAYEQLLSIGFKSKELIKRNANTNKMITPYRDKITGKFTPKSTQNKTIAYHEEYILKVIK